MKRDYLQTVERFRLANIKHNAFELYYGDKLPILISNKINACFDFPIEDKVYLVRRYYDENKNEHFTVISEQGLYADPLGRGLAVKWSDVSEIRKERDNVATLLFIRHNRVLLRSNIDCIVPGYSDEVLSLIESLSSFVVNDDYRTLGLRRSFAKTFAQFNGYTQKEDFEIVDFGKSAFDCIDSDFQNKLIESSMQDDETILLFRDATRWNTEYLFITDKKFYFWTDDKFKSFSWAELNKVVPMEDKLWFVDHRGETILSVPHYNVVKKRAKLFEDSELNNTLAKQIANAFNRVIREVGDEIRKLKSCNDITEHYREAPLLAETIKPVCPHCGSVDYEFYYSQEYFEQEKKNKAKHWAGQIAGEIFSIILTKKPGPYSNYEGGNPDEVKCSKCGHVWKL